MFQFLLRRAFWRSFFTVFFRTLDALRFLFAVLILRLTSFPPIGFLFGRIVAGSILYGLGILLTPIPHSLLAFLSYIVPPQFVFPLAMPYYFAMFILNFAHIS